MTTELKRMMQLYASSASWAASPLIPFQGEACVEIVNANDMRVKFGDGARTFPNLPYSGGDLAGSVVRSFNGRSPSGGNIAPGEDDYDASMIGESGGLIWFTPTERQLLGALDPAAQIPAGGSAGQILARASADPRTYIWVDPTPGTPGARRTSELLDWSQVAPAEGQIPVFRNSDRLYHLENPSTSAATRIKKAASRISGKAAGTLVRFDGTTEDKLTFVNLANGAVRLQFDNLLTHAADELIVGSFMTENYSPIEDYRMFFESLDPLAATAPTLALFQSGSKTSGSSSTPLTAGANTHTLVVPAGNNVAVRLVYAVNPADVAQPTRTDGFDITIAGGASSVRAWTDTSANVVNNLAPHLCFYEMVLGNPAAPVTYTFKPRWLDASNVLSNNGNVSAYNLMMYVFAGADQSKPFEGRHTETFGTDAQVVTSKVATDGPGRYVVHNVWKRSNLQGNPITSSAGFTLNVEASTGSQLNASNLRFMSVSTPFTTEAESYCSFTFPAPQNYGWDGFAVRPAVITGMIVHVTNERPAYIAGSNILATIMYDSNIRQVNVSF